MGEAKKPKLGYGQGTIMQDKHGRWIGRYYDGWTKTGNPRRREVSGKNATDVAAKLRAAQRERASGKQAATLTVKAWADQWLEGQRETRRPATVQGNVWALGYIVPAVGGVKVSSLTPAHAKRAWADVPGEASARKIHSTFLAMLRAAVREGIDVPAPVLALPAPKVRRSDRQDIPLDHALAIIRAASKHPDAARWLLPFLCGLRQGETLGLTWDRVDLDAGMLRVDRQLTTAPWAHGKDCGCPRTRRPASCPEKRLDVPRGYDYEVIQDRFMLASVKTAAGERLVPLVPAVRDALAAREGRAGLVFQRDGGGPIPKPWDNAAWHALQDDAGVKHSSGRYYGLHEARHSCATLLMALQVPLPVIQAIVGHSSIVSTMTYLHSDQAQARAALEQVAGRLTA